MDKIDHNSRDILGNNIEKIAELFPSVVSEAQDQHTGKLKKVVDFDLLRQHLSNTLIEGDRERFRMDWPGKKASILKANTPTTKTLRPVREDSVDFDTTGNIFIEGDNFEVLKVLQESYLGKIKMIYIDPPYNTGKDFIYNDNFTVNREEYEEELGVRDDESGGKLIKNTESNGRYHSDWLSMMQERLIVARDLLTDDGVIFISIDDNEQANLKKLADDIFGNDNFIAQVVWERAYSPVNLKHHFSESHDYILCYARYKEQTQKFTLNRSSDADGRYKNPDNDPRGPWKASDYSVGPANRKNIYEITTPSGRKALPPSGYSWRFSQEKTQELIKDNRVWFGESGNNVPAYKRFLSEVKNGVTPMTIWKYKDVGHSQDATKEVKELFDGKAYFEYPKPSRLIMQLINLNTSNNDIVLDFFSGSGTTAHAVMQLNAEDGNNRKHIQVQLAESIGQNSEVYNDGYRTIAEISRERIRRAATKILAEYAEKITKRDTPLDTGFRTYKLASSNFKDVSSHPTETMQTTLLDATDNIKENRSAEDLLTETILNLGLTLDLPIESRKIAGRVTYFVGGNSLVACFDDAVSIDIVDSIAAEKPLRVVFKDSSFANDEVRINADIRLKQLSPDTTVQVV